MSKFLRQRLSLARRRDEWFAAVKDKFTSAKDEVKKEKVRSDEYCDSCECDPCDCNWGN